MFAFEILLVLGVVGVGVLHTLVPDHWLPIALLARQRGWTRMETARAAAQAGAGHVATTLLLGLLAWAIGSAAAKSYAELIDGLASLALVGFGLWIAWGAWRDTRRGTGGRHQHSHSDGRPHGHSHPHGPSLPSETWARDPLYKPLGGSMVAESHEHWHRHGNGSAHRHWHDHEVSTAHALAVDAAAIAPLHLHLHGTSGRTALLLVLGSSPMVEGVPAFFAASSSGPGLLVTMAVAFAFSTVATYVVVSVVSASRLQRVNLGPIEQYGEVLSGLLMVAIGLAFGAASIL